MDFFTFSFSPACASQPDMDSRVNGVSSPTVHDGRLLAENSGGALNVKRVVYVNANPCICTGLGGETVVI